ncbi:hypothetical protein FRB90_003091, partial [Tulasnella sp. 427]
MPRAPASSATNGVLRRYQACHRCRKQKLKSHAYAVRVDPLNAPDEPICTYDDPDVKSVGPKARIAALESENAELRALLQQANEKIAQCTCGAAQMYQSPGANGGIDSVSPWDSISMALSPTNATSFQPTPAISTPDATFISDPVPNATISALLDPTDSWNFPSVQSIAGFTPEGSPNSFALSTDVWPLNIPPPETLYHLVETFFSSLPLATRLIHQPTFMASLRHSPTSPEFPHVSILHAICGIASLYSPVIVEPRRDSPMEGYAARPFASGVISRPQGDDGVQREPVYPRKMEDILGPMPSGFGATHIHWAGDLLKVASRVGDRLIQQVQGLHVSEGFEPLSRFPAKMIFLIGSPKDHIQAETARNVFWIAYVVERIITGGTVWPLQISDEDVSQLMPCRLADFVSGTFVPTHGRQTLFTENMVCHHPSLITDSWTLYIKATILMSQVRNFNGRYRITSKMQSPRSPTPPTQSAEFNRLDSVIEEFSRQIPQAFREPVETKVDPLLYMAHLLPYVAMIQLHDPHVNFNDPSNKSTARLSASVDKMMDLIHSILATSFDLIYLDHSTSFCWFVAGATIIRFLKAAAERDQQDVVWKLTQNLQTVKFVLGNLGERTTVG